LTTLDVCPSRRALAVLIAITALATPAVAQAASFDPPMSYPVGGIRPLAVAVGDINGDGINDVAVANNDSNDVSVLHGKAGGGFDAAVTFPAGSAPAGVAIADLNGDSRADLAVPNRLSSNVSVLFGKAGGGFEPAVGFAAGNQPFGIAVGDVNGDSRNDMLVANRVSDDVSVLLGNAGGGFDPAVSVPAGDGPQSLALGDLDEDGDLDVALALTDGDLMSILHGNGAGGFSAPALYTAGNGPQSVAVGDLKEDGRVDVAVANFFSDFASVFLNQGAGVFSRHTGFGTGDGPRSLAIGDLDADGHRDLAIADSDSDTVSVLAGDGAGGFAPRQVFDGGDAPSSIAIAQLNGAGLPDIVVADRFGEVVSVLGNTGAEPPPPDTTPPVITTPAPMSVDATSAAGAQVEYTVTVTDNRDAEPDLSCTPPSGSTFPIGTTTVQCTATDEAGNSSTATFTVKVVDLDTGVPTITTPDSITVNATSPAGAVVTYSASVSDDRDANPTLSCVPASGSTFAIGTKTVTCTARDASGNTSVKTFAVKVKGAPEQIVDVIDKLRTIRGLAPVSTALRTQLESIATCVVQKRKTQACLGVSLFVTLARYAISRGYMTPAQGNEIIADLQRIKAVIGCP
jgi:hypothetical protein